MPAIDLINVSVGFPVYSARTRSIRSHFLSIGGRIQSNGDGSRTIVRALNNVNLSLRAGDRVGLIGPNGAGKSTLLRVLSGIYEPPQGIVRIEGTVATLLDMTLGIDPELNGLENIVLRSVVLGKTIAEAKAKTPEIAEFSGLGDFLELPVRTYSAGMLLRLAFSVSTAYRPDIAILDEVVGAGDAEFSERASLRIREVTENASIMVMASHDTAALRKFCNRMAILRGGEIVQFGPIDEVLPEYQHRATEPQPSVRSHLVS
jgi:ABC-type polysaccharide/polyol phosphate transport system ATPase subunit